MSTITNSFFTIYHLTIICLRLKKLSIAEVIFANIPVCLAMGGQQGNWRSQRFVCYCNTSSGDAVTLRPHDVSCATATHRQVMRWRCVLASYWPDAGEPLPIGLLQSAYKHSLPTDFYPRSYNARKQYSLNICIIHVEGINITDGVIDIYSCSWSLSGYICLSANQW